MFKKYGFAWITGALFIASFTGHWVLGWVAYVEQQTSLGLPAQVGPYLIEAVRDTLENWQSEFLQVAWQVAGLSFLLYKGSPQSRDTSDRVEGKIDRIAKDVRDILDGRE